MAATGVNGGNVSGGQGTTSNPSTSPSLPATAPSAPSTTPDTVTDGWYIAVACVGSILLANTQFAPILAGLLGVGLIYQLNSLLEGS